MSLVEVRFAGMSGLVAAGMLVGLVLAVGLRFLAVVPVTSWVTGGLGRTVLLLAVSAGLLGM